MPLCLCIAYHYQTYNVCMLLDPFRGMTRGKTPQRPISQAKPLGPGPEVKN